MLSLNANKKALDLSYKISENIPLDLKGDSVRLKQILINLLNNAIKFTEKGFVKLNIDLKNLDNDFVDLSFSVKDSGIGIPENKKDKLFKTFSQLDSSITRKYGGTGLGLAITSQLIKLMGGNINVESIINKGSAFNFNLIFKLSQNKQVKQQVISKNDIKTCKYKNLKILLVEDNFINRKLIVSILEKINVKVDTAENGFQAVEKFKNNKYNLILMDLQMPDMDGFEVTKIIRNTNTENCKTIPIIALTAHILKEYKDKAFETGMNDFISKPVKINTLYSALEKWIDFSNFESSECKSKSNIIDFDGLLEVLSNDIDLLKTLYISFIRTSKDFIMNFRNFYQTDNLNGLTKTAHSLRGLMLNLYIKVSIKELEELEFNINKLSKERILENINNVESDLNKVETVFKEKYIY